MVSQFFLCAKHGQIVMGKDDIKGEVVLPQPGFIFFFEKAMSSGWRLYLKSKSLDRRTISLLNCFLNLTAFFFQNLNDEMFSILVLTALFTTFITTPIVMPIYKLARGNSTKTRRKLGDSSWGSRKEMVEKFRVLACLHRSSNIPSIINLIESTQSTKKSLIKLFMMHLVKLTEPLILYHHGSSCS